MKKKFVILVAVLAMAFTPVISNAASLVSVIIDGVQIQYSDEMGFPYVDSTSRTQVPLNKTMTEFGAAVSWDESTETVTVVKGETTVAVPVGVKYILVNGVKQEIDTAALVKNGRTYLPIAHVLRAFDATVSWDETKNAVIVTTDSNAGSAPSISQEQQTSETEEPVKKSGSYVGSIGSNKYHYPSCRHAEKILPENEIWFDTIDEAKGKGYQACGVCHPI